MTKNELIAAIREVEPERTVSSLKKESVADLAMIWEEIKPVAKEAVFRDREEVREHIDRFKEHRSKVFQPAIYRSDAARLKEALNLLLEDLHGVAAAAGVTL